MKKVEKFILEWKTLVVKINLFIWLRTSKA